MKTFQCSQEWIKKVVQHPITKKVAAIFFMWAFLVSVFELFEFLREVFQFRLVDFHLELFLILSVIFVEMTFLATKRRRLLHEEIVEEQKKRIEAETSLREHFKKAAYHDGLTGLPNKLFLLEKMNQLVVSAKQKSSSFGVVYIDVDEFKTINDLYGHATGDELLVQVSHRMRRMLRGKDLLARVGGDEFVALVVDLGKSHEIDSILSRLLLSVTSPFTLQDITVQVSVSIGVAFFPHDAEEGETLLRYADKTMYEAKRSGKNKFSLFSSQTNAHQASLRSH